MESKKKDCRAARYTRVCSLGLVLSAVPLLADAVAKTPLDTARHIELAQSTSSFKFDIAPQSLKTALDKFIDVSGWQLGYPTRLVEGVTTRGVTGSMSAQEAIEQLLAGSGLVVKASAPGVATLVEQSVEASVVLAPVTVTAQRVEQEAQKVPISLEVMQAKEIEEKGYERLSQILAQTTNVGTHQQSSAYFATPVIRGIGNEIPFLDPSVSVFVDGSPMPGGLSDFDLKDVERVEIMRGPQSALFGQNSLAGAINVVTKPVLRKGWSVRTQGKYGSDKHSGGNFLAQGALVEDKVGLRVSANQSYTDGYVKNTRTGNIVGGTENKNLRMTADTSPTDNIDVSFTYEHRNDISSGQVDTVKRRSYSFDAPGDPTETRSSDGFVGTVKWFGDQYELVSQTGFRTMDLNHKGRFVAFGNNIINDVLTDEEYLSQEFRIVSPKEGSELGWQAGVYFADETFKVTQDLASGAAKQAFKHKQDTRRYEAFGQVDYDVVKDWTLTFGGRVSKVKRDVVHSYTTPDTFLTPAMITMFRAAGIPFTNPIKGQNVKADTSRSFSNAVGQVALNYAISPDANAYVSLGQGFKAGTARSGALTARELFLPSEKATTGEIGTKLQFLDTTFNAAAFYTNYKNRHTFFNTGAGQNKVLAVPKAKSWGGELAVDQKLLEGWSAFGRVGYLHSKFGALTIQPVQPRSKSVNIDGNKFRAAPTWTTTLGSRFEDSFADGWSYFVNGDYTYQSKSFGNISNTKTSVNKGYGLVNAGFGVRKDHVAFSFNATNILDTYHYTSTSQADGRGAPGAPARFVAGVTIDLGP